MELYSDAEIAAHLPDYRAENVKNVVAAKVSRDDMKAITGAYGWDEAKSELTVALNIHAPYYTDDLPALPLLSVVLIPEYDSYEKIEEKYGKDSADLQKIRKNVYAQRIVHRKMIPERFETEEEKDYADLCNRTMDIIQSGTGIFSDEEKVEYMKKYLNDFETAYTTAIKRSEKNLLSHELTHMLAQVESGYLGLKGTFSAPEEDILNTRNKLRSQIKEDIVGTLKYILVDLSAEAMEEKRQETGEEVAEEERSGYSDHKALWNETLAYTYGNGVNKEQLSLILSSYVNELYVQEAQTKELWEYTNTCLEARASLDEVRESGAFSEKEIQNIAFSGPEKVLQIFGKSQNALKIEMRGDN